MELGLPKYCTTHKNTQPYVHTFQCLIRYICICVYKGDLEGQQSTRNGSSRDFEAVVYDQRLHSNSGHSRVVPSLNLGKNFCVPKLE